MSPSINAVYNYVENLFETQEGSHDFFHIERVLKLALHLHSVEGGEKEIIELTCLLHDISDHKYNGGILNNNGQIAIEIMKKCGVSDNLINAVIPIIDNISFKGAYVEDKNLSVEQKIVQDADRLDAIGAIGIARAFAYGGSKKRKLFDPNTPFQLHNSFEEYVQGGTHTINHFHEKLVLLYDRLHTKEAKRIGLKRHKYLVSFVEKFQEEWFLKDC